MTDEKIAKTLDELHSKCLHHPLIEHISHDELSALFYAHSTIARQDAENREIWKERCRIYESLKEAKADIERMKEFCNNFSESLSVYSVRAQVAKFEAYEEVIERLKNLPKNRGDLATGFTGNVPIYYVNVKDIENLIKELAEGEMKP